MYVGVTVQQNSKLITRCAPYTYLIVLDTISVKLKCTHHIPSTGHHLATHKRLFCIWGPIADLLQWKTEPKK